jgi:hypothetical protein
MGHPSCNPFFKWDTALRAVWRMVAFDLAYTGTDRQQSEERRVDTTRGGYRVATLHYNYLIEDPLLESWNIVGASDPDPRKKFTAKVLIRLALFIYSEASSALSRFCIAIDLGSAFHLD